MSNKNRETGLVVEHWKTRRNCSLFFHPVVLFLTGYLIAKRISGYILNIHDSFEIRVKYVREVSDV